jgi:hypothetical protein
MAFHPRFDPDNPDHIRGLPDPPDLDMDSLD